MQKSFSLINIDKRWVQIHVQVLVFITVVRYLFLFVQVILEFFNILGKMMESHLIMLFRLSGVPCNYDVSM